MSSIAPPGQKMGFRPVRRNSTVKRPLPVPPPVPPVIPSYAIRPPLHPEVNGMAGFHRNSNQPASPCAKIYTGGNGKSKPSPPSSLPNYKFGAQKKIISNDSLPNCNTNSNLSLKPYDYSKQKHLSGVNVTNTSVVVINCLDESKVNKTSSLVLNKAKKSVKIRNKSQETKKIQVFTKYEEELPKLSAASFIFRSLRTAQRSKPLRLCDFQQVYDTLGCDKTNDEDLTKSPPLIYETQEICLWLSDDGDNATEDVFSSSLGINLELIKNLAISLYCLITLYQMRQTIHFYSNVFHSNDISKYFLLNDVYFIMIT